MTAAAADPADLPPAGRLVGGEHRLPVRVYWEDTDASGVAYHAGYLRWMERGRSEMLALLGVDQAALAREGGGAYAVAEIGVRYLAPARLGDALVVATRVARVRAAGVAVQQRVRRGDALLADARVTAALVGPAGRPVRQPAAWVAAFRRLAERPNESGEV